MRLLKNIRTEKYQEIEVENSFLWIKWKTKYRKFDRSIFKFKEPNKYYSLGLLEFSDVHELFNIEL